MRTDIEIITRGSVVCPKITWLYPSKRHVERGDFIEWNDQGTQYRGRVIGFTQPPEGGTFLVCAMLSLGGAIWERWADPNSVTASCDGSKGYTSLYGDKAKWFFSEDFLKTDPKIARDVSNKLAKDL